jgi:hypothetical protein
MVRKVLDLTYWAFLISVIDPSWGLLLGASNSYGVASYKASHALQQFSDLLCYPVGVLSISDSSTRALWLQQRQQVAKQGVGEKCPWIKSTWYLCYTPQRFLTCHKILWHGADGFTSPPKEGVLRIVSPSALFEPSNLRSICKHANHYTTEDYILRPVSSHRYADVLCICVLSNVQSNCSSLGAVRDCVAIGLD